MNATRTIYAKPADGRTVPLEDGGAWPAEGKDVPLTRYVRRRLADGDLVEARRPPKTKARADTDKKPDDGKSS